MRGMIAKSVKMNHANLINLDNFHTILWDDEIEMNHFLYIKLLSIHDAQTQMSLEFKCQMTNIKS